VQISSFDLQKGGYRISDVDGALMRLERAISDKHTRWEVEYRGTEGWMEETLGLALTLKPRVQAPLCKRFDNGKRKSVSYDRQQVDQVMDDSWYTICKHLSISPEAKLRDPLDVDAIGVSDSIFTQKKGKKGYGEPSVDAYLNRVVQVLNRIESFKRLGYRMPDPSSLRPSRRGFEEEVGTGPREREEKVYVQASSEHPDLGSLVSRLDEEGEGEKTAASSYPHSPLKPDPPSDPPSQSRGPADGEEETKIWQPSPSPAASPAPLQRRRHAQSKKFFGFSKHSSRREGDED
ncbi:MAG: hypothetical protein IKS61_00755, partial [Aeriscardovia sp.]|nr:hypothetical protein [Aeriscardovia sp.]